MNKHKKAKLKSAKLVRLKEEFRDTYRVCFAEKTLEDTFGLSIIESFKIYKEREPKAMVAKYDIGKNDYFDYILLKHLDLTKITIINDFYADSNEYVYFFKLN